MRFMLLMCSLMILNSQTLLGHCHDDNPPKMIHKSATPCNKVTICGIHKKMQFARYISVCEQTKILLLDSIWIGYPITNPPRAVNLKWVLICRDYSLWKFTREISINLRHQLFVPAILITTYPALLYNAISHTKRR